MSELITPLTRPARPLLADVVPALRERTALLVVSGALVLAAASQVRIPLGFTPVPINLATFTGGRSPGTTSSPFTARTPTHASPIQPILRASSSG